MGLYSYGKKLATKAVKIPLDLAQGDVGGAVGELTGQNDAYKEQKNAYDTASKSYGDLGASQRNEFLGPGGSLDQQKNAWDGAYNQGMGAWGNAQSRQDQAFSGVQSSLNRTQGAADYANNQLSSPGLLENYAPGALGQLGQESNLQGFLNDNNSRRGALGFAMDEAARRNARTGAATGLSGTVLKRQGDLEQQGLLSNYLAQEGNLANRADEGNVSRINAGFNWAGAAQTAQGGRLGQIYGNQLGISAQALGLGTGQANAAGNIGAGEAGTAMGAGAGQAGSIAAAYANASAAEQDAMKNQIMTQLMKSGMSMQQAQQNLQMLVGGAKVIAGGAAGGAGGASAALSGTKDVKGAFG